MEITERKEIHYYKFFVVFFFNFQYLFTNNINRLNGGKTSTEAPLFSPHLGCQGLPGLDRLIACNKHDKYIISIRLDQTI